MATLILSGVGRLVAGPLGGAVGAVLGNALDHRLLGPKARQGARLSDLAVQASEYGTTLPKLFGRTRVAGTVIWATDLRETRTQVSQGKGRPKTDTYSYSASFAVALSARPVVRVERIWADGSLLRGAGGDWKRDAVMRLHTGDESQAIDPLIASAEGLASCPAYRGIAYAVFENLPLGDFGNRIPQLSFELVADEGAVSAGALLGGTGGPMFGGYAVTGGSLGDTSHEIERLAPFRLIDSIPQFDVGPLHTVAAVERGAMATRAANGALPVQVSIDYADGNRDYQAGRQAARRLANGLGEESIALPAVMDAGIAKGLAENVLARRWRERTRCEVSLDWRGLAIQPGDRVTLPGEATIWRVTASIVEGGSVRLSLVAHGLSAIIGGESDPGRGVSEPDLAAGETLLAVIDLPPLGTVSASAMVAVLANGTSAGWRRAALTTSRDGGASWVDTGGTALPATIGVATNVLPAAASRVIDRVNSVDVMLAHSGLTLTDADHAGLANGANLAMLGEEALQFGSAEPLGGGVWRLSELWRGRCGTEYAVGGHVVGESFAVIAGAEMRLLAPEDAIAGALVGAQGVGDSVALQSPVTSADRALRPLSPVTLRAAPVTGGTMIRWTRRSRDGFFWRDGVDAPMAEERETYAVDASGGGALMSAEVDAPEWLLPTGFAPPGTGASITVRQIGRTGLSDPATVSFTI